MKILVAVIAVLALATPATASAPARDPRVPALQKQLRSLKGQLASVRGELNSMNNRMSSAFSRLQQLQDIDECHFAINLDNDEAFYGIARIVLPSLPPGPGRYDDHGACQRAGLARSGG